MESWKKALQGYEIKRWDQSNFDIAMVPYVKQAIDQKMWAFAADFIRLYALHEEGGIYLDCDVFLRRSLDAFLGNAFFSSVEYHPDMLEEFNATKGVGILSALLGSVPGHPFLNDCMEYYRENDFISCEYQLASGKIAPEVLADTATKYGFEYKDEQQKLREDILIYPSTVFASTPKLSTRRSFAIHYCAGSWKENSGINKVKIFNLPKWIRKNIIIRKLWGKPPHIDFK